PGVAAGGGAGGGGGGRAGGAFPTGPGGVPTADRPIRMRPPVSAVVPAMMEVVPRLNSLIVLPNPIVAMPAAATTIPNISNITDIRLRPSRNPPYQVAARCYGY